MHEHRSAHAAPTTTSVRGLGVCDVLQVELAADQAADVRRALGARIAALRQRLAAADDDERCELQHALRLLEQMHTREPALLGPAGLVLELVQACFTDAIAALARQLHTGAEPLPQIAHHTQAAAAWAKTLGDCRAVTSYTFEPGLDPAYAW